MLYLKPRKNHHVFDVGLINTKKSFPCNFFVHIFCSPLKNKNVSTLCSNEIYYCKNSKIGTLFVRCKIYFVVSIDHSKIRSERRKRENGEATEITEKKV
jgi:hypothetical protein